MKFHYQIITATGDSESGLIEAQSERLAVRDLSSKGAVVVELKPARNKKTARPGKVKIQEILQFFDELVTLLVAGVSLVDALVSLTDNQFRPGLAVALEAMVNGLEQGKPFSQVLMESQLQIPEFVLHLASAGELSGKLAQALQEAVSQMRFDEEVRGEMRNALIYPAVLVISGTLAVTLVFTLVVPKFSNLLTRDVDLPWLGEAVLRTGLFLNAYSLYLLIAVGLIVIALISLFSREEVRLTLLDHVSRWPLVGEWLVESETGRWSSVLGALLGSGVPIMDALDLANKGVRVRVRQKKLMQATVAVKSGEALSAALQEQKALLPAAYNILRVGEKAGELPAMLKSLAALYDKSGKNRMKRMLLLIEPMAILLIGGAIGVVMLGIILAITSATDVPL